ncbi:glycosyl hydrolase family 61-domain-containing protein [Lenzites betulinus]|nr:glycosyl hydrolase family 61-domain-containing protein [Lenzites betulinus]
MFSTSLSLAALALAFVAPSAVNAHGYIHNYEIDGKNYSGWLPFTDPYLSPIPSRIERNIPDDGPVLDVTSPDLACNKGGETGAKSVAPVTAGSQITFDWQEWPADHLGPVSTYMAACNGDCVSFDATKAKWFKIDAAGYNDKVWASTQLIDNGFKWTSTIPSELKAGEYLVRHEIVALHDAGQPQFYPSCAQVKVSGSGTQVPSGASLVSIPGLYTGFTFPDIWDDNFKSFTIPGPAVAFTGSSSGSEQSDPAPSSTHASSTHAPTSSAASHAASSTQVHTSAVTSAQESATPAAASSVHTSSTVAASKPSSTGTGRCSSKRSRRRGMVKRHVSHLAKRHH